MTPILETVCAVALIAALAQMILYLASVSRELHEARRDTSRFPLFAVRGKLVRLVAEGELAEDDPAWRNLYAQVNFLLRMDQRLDLPDLVSRYLRSQVEAEQDQVIKARISDQIALEEQTAARVPGFAEAVEETHRALLFLVHRRTTRLRMAVLLAVVGLGMFIATFKGGVSSARVVKRAVQKPSSSNVMKWQAVDGDLFGHAT